MNEDAWEPPKLLPFTSFANQDSKSNAMWHHSGVEEITATLECLKGRVTKVSAPSVTRVWAIPRCEPHRPEAPAEGGRKEEWMAGERDDKP